MNASFEITLQLAARAKKKDTEQLVRQMLLEELRDLVQLHEVPTKSGAYRVTVTVEKVRSCKSCGCTDDSACDGGCSWVAADLCSACVMPGGLP